MGADYTFIAKNGATVTLSLYGPIAFEQFPDFHKIHFGSSCWDVEDVTFFKVMHWFKRYSEIRK